MKAPFFLFIFRFFIFRFFYFEFIYFYSSFEWKEHLRRAFNPAPRSRKEAKGDNKDYHARSHWAEEDHNQHNSSRQNPAIFPSSSSTPKRAAQKASCYRAGNFATGPVCLAQLFPICLCKCLYFRTRRFTFELVVILGEFLKNFPTKKFRRKIFKNYYFQKVEKRKLLEL